MSTEVLREKSAKLRELNKMVSEYVSLVDHIGTLKDNEQKRRILVDLRDKIDKSIHFLDSDLTIPEKELGFRERPMFEKLKRDYVRLKENFDKSVKIAAARDKDLQRLLSSSLSMEEGSLKRRLTEESLSEELIETIDHFQAIGFYHETVLGQKVDDIKEIQIEMTDLKTMFDQMAVDAEKQGQVLEQAKVELAQTKSNINHVQEGLEIKQQTQMKSCRRFAIVMLFLMVAGAAVAAALIA
mmetsp:Transcript_9096/g.9876  ORF Transcript_9096/g.9876 Transcript_9096/m.9876 type:complete len:241 (-) Transcript_9096:133-855(-)|eukprot:CAMPEP_0114992054 /NCGR_PEP_ID=MMETSP0216-20121206/11724_1 /TAXON_ID=223996 /ORGANISM="Protocruzia adherens, Strain Boccale" /LENGTH=240 /DNA_ID=CAMNT_0002355469 /DNA_START=207 /DNA_END=929 /DNA_ORIENTATION=-